VDPLVLLESPDAIIRDGEIIFWSDRDSWCFGYLYPIDLYCAWKRSIHIDIIRDLKKIGGGRQPTSLDAAHAGKRPVQIPQEYKLFRGNSPIHSLKPDDLEYINSLSANTPSSARLCFDMAGRYWTDRKIISFWSSRNKIADPLDPFVKAGLNPAQWKFEFIDTEGALIPYSDLGKSIPSTISKERQRELMTQQHLDPSAKKQLAAQPGAVQAPDRLRGFKTPAERNFKTKVGDSLAMDLVRKLVD